MAEKRYFWLKLEEDFFRQKAMKKLRIMERGEVYTIIYLKMQLASLRYGGALLFDGVEDTFAGEMALQLDERVEDVEVTVNFLTKHKLLVQLSETENLLPKAAESIGAEGSSAKRMREFRQRASQSDGGGVTSLRREEKSRVDKSRVDKSREEERERRGEAAPTLAEVEAYCASQGFTMQPVKFFDYYAARGWMMGQSPIKDWRAAARNWESREKKTDSVPMAGTSGFHDVDF